MLTESTRESSDAGEALLARIAGFVSFLHENGYGVGGADSARAVEVAARTGVLDESLMRWNLRAQLCNRFEEWQRFDALFDAYFLPPNKKAFAERDVPAGRRKSAVEREQEGADEAAGDTEEGGSDDADEARHGASHEENLAATDFSELSKAEQARKIEALMRRLARRLKHLRLRREARSRRGRRLDLQGTIRHSVASGGMPLELSWKTRRRVRPRLVLLLDVSRSMSFYSFFYLRLARALCKELADVHCFIFNTRITSVGDALRDKNPWRAQERLHVLAVGWAGGTRIGECLQEFNRGQGARLVHSRTGIIIVSDGYDTGEPSMLSAELGTLQRRARRLVWLNPLLNQPGFTPAAQGMQAAMPHLDLLAAGADLAEIERILPALIDALR